MKQFKVDNTYSMRSVCDHNCIWECKVISRTKCFLTLKVSGYRDPIKCKVSQYEGEETCFPLGHFSMAPILRA